MLNAATLSSDAPSDGKNIETDQESVSIDPTTYQHNLSALRAFQPAIAKVIDDTPVPATTRCMQGRDGAATFQLPDATGRTVFLGGSSMPSISAEEMFSTATDSGGNVTLPGILTGLEPIVLARRLPECRAIFVVESSPLFLKLAMQLHDYSALFSRGRLMFLLDDDLPMRVTEFFKAYPGFLLPTQIFRVPQRTPAEIYSLQGRLESIGEKVGRLQAEALDSAVGRISRTSSRKAAENPRVAILGTDASPASIEFAVRIARGLKKLGWTHSLCVPDSPGKCHIVARTNAMAQIDADVAIWINSGPGPVKSILPSIPMIAWYSPNATVPSMGDEPASEEFLAVSGCEANRLDAAGVKTRVEFVAPAADDTVFHPLEADERDAAFETEIAVLANLPVADPQRCGVNLPSLLAMWQSAEKIIQCNPDGYNAALAGSIIAQAERECGIALQDPKIRDQFEGHVRNRIAPAAIARINAEGLCKAGFQITVWGENWRIGAQDSLTHLGPIPAPSRLNQVFNGAGAVVIPNCEDTDLQIALDAMCAGACVILRGEPLIDAGRNRIDPDLEPFLNRYGSRSELITKVRRLLLNRDGRMAASIEAHKLVLARHTVSHRIKQVVDRLRIR